MYFVDDPTMDAVLEAIVSGDGILTESSISSQWDGTLEISITVRMNADALRRRKPEPDIVNPEISWPERRWLDKVDVERLSSTFREEIICSLDELIKEEKK